MCNNNSGMCFDNGSDEYTDDNNLDKSDDDDDGDDFSSKRHKVANEAISEIIVLST